MAPLGPGVVAGIAALLSAIGSLQALAGWRVTVRFAARRTPPPESYPRVSVLKPLYGEEPLLEQALASICAQDYPEWQVVFGVQDPADPAVGIVRRLQLRFPGCDIAVVVDPSRHGANLKVGNLINMLPAAKHEVLVIADSDLHVLPDYLERLVAALAVPSTGLVTTLYAGKAARDRIVARLGAMQITSGFLPGALLARALGRQDCLGATMCLHRDTLARIGGLHVLVDHLADDNVLGRYIRGLGLGIGLADTVPATTVPETRIGALFRHELRWARTIRALVPMEFAASILQHSLFWAAVAIVASGGAMWSLGLFGVSWLLRAAAATGIDRALAGRLDAGACSCPVALLPLRDFLSVAVMVTSYAGRRVEWRGHHLHAQAAPPASARSLADDPHRGTAPRHRMPPDQARGERSIAAP
jgi:ceramide glucosyltransferase